MANESISQLAAVGTIHTDDLLVDVDTHDTTMAPSGTDKKLTFSQLFATLTGDVTASGFATTIATHAVGLTKLATGTANRLIGYDGSGNPASISGGTNISISAGVISASGGSGASVGLSASFAARNLVM